MKKYIKLFYEEDIAVDSCLTRFILEIKDICNINFSKMPVKLHKLYSMMVYDRALIFAIVYGKYLTDNAEDSSDIDKLNIGIAGIHDIISRSISDTKTILVSKQLWKKIF